MRPFARRSWLPGLCALALSVISSQAAAPKDGRYRGTLTLRTVVDGTKAEVKKVFAIGGVLTGGSMTAIMAEIPDLDGKFGGLTLQLVAADDYVTMQPDGQIIYVFSDASTTAARLKGEFDLGAATGADGRPSSQVKNYLALTMTRVGN